MRALLEVARVALSMSVVLAGTEARAQLLGPDLTIPGVLGAEVVVPGETWVQGVPTRFLQGRSAWSVRDLFAHYYVAFASAGFHIPPERAQMRVVGSLQLTAVNVDTDMTHTVVLTPRRDGTTLVTLGQADFSRARVPSASDDNMPLPPGARNVLRTRSEGSWTLALETSASEKQLAQHYDQQLKARGYQKLEAGVYARGGRYLRVIVKDEKGTRHVLLSEHGAAETSTATGAH